MSGPLNVTLVRRTSHVVLPCARAKPTKSKARKPPAAKFRGAPAATLALLPMLTSAAETTKPTSTCSSADTQTHIVMNASSRALVVEKEKETMQGNSRVKFRVTSGGLRISTAAAQFARLRSVDTGAFAFPALFESPRRAVALVLVRMHTALCTRRASAMNPVARLDTDRHQHGRPTPARVDGAQGPAVRERPAEEQIYYVTSWPQRST